MTFGQGQKARGTRKNCVSFGEEYTRMFIRNIHSLLNGSGSMTPGSLGELDDITVHFF